jgi:phospholipid-binding lipoprotein MlaA
MSKYFIFHHLRKAIPSAFAALMLFAATLPAAANVPDADPLESFNRAMFAFNEGVDTVLLRPVARVYRAVAPSYARKGLRNASRHLGEPVNATNGLLQGDVHQAFAATWRFALNTVFGFGGLYDFAGTYGNLPYRREDFGQTIAVWAGTNESTYIVLPLLGPSTLRDTFGRVVDSVTTPWYYVLNDNAVIGLTAAEVIIQREAMLDVTDQIYATSFDPYSSFRSAYIQRRNALIANRAPKEDIK